MNAPVPRQPVARPRKPRAVEAPTGKPPTARQQQALDLIVQGRRAGEPPTLRELGRRLGIRSTNGVSCLLRALVRKGWLERDPEEPARCTYRPTQRLPPITPAWLLDHAERLAQALDQQGRAVLVSDLACSTPWWRLSLTTGGSSTNEAAVSAADPVWHRITHQASVRGGLHVWAWGPVPAELGGPLAPVLVGPWPSPV